MIVVALPITAQGFDIKNYPDVMEYVRNHVFWGVRADVERLQDPRREIFLVLQMDDHRVQRSRRVKLWNVEYDPTGNSRGFFRNSQTNRIENRRGISLLTLVYTRWATDWERRRPGDNPINGKITDDLSWESDIKATVDEVRASHEGARVSMHEPVPPNRRS